MQGKKRTRQTDSCTESDFGRMRTFLVCADLTDREQILDVMKKVGIEQEDVHECLV